MPRFAPPQRVLIVGAGEFGSTTALALARGAYKGHEHLITVLDRSPTPPATDAASYDYNKIVRQEYTDPLYANLAREAMIGWRGEWKEFFHETGVIMTARPAGVATAEKSYAVNFLPGMETPGKCARKLSGKADVQAQYGAGVPLGDFADCYAYHNECGGWAEAARATEAAVAKARAAGVTFRCGTAKKLVVNGGRVTGVVTEENADAYTADLVVLCCGSWTPTLVPDLKENLLPTGQVVGFVQLTPEEHERYKDVPVTMTALNGFYIFPPTATGLVKFAIHELGYLNPQAGYPSLPRTHLSRGYEMQSIPAHGHAKLLRNLAAVYPELAKKPFSASRLCWYSDRQSGDFLLDYHPEYNGTLFIGAGGSGHAFKFLPVIGGLIEQGIQGTMPQQYRDIFGYKSRPDRVDGRFEYSEFTRLDGDSKL
ncbi:hypothetical protein Q8F55_008437 [Vanrija albida]|uniref:FAD dependent oxidoreductase domain-containing protein n=1 Tax=Vanrija albida TaxID=181172 RepID=A0ABR3PRS9_9TREE